MAYGNERSLNRQSTLIQVRFSQKGSTSLPKFTSENLKNKLLVPCWESFLTSAGSALTQRTLWMSEKNSTKACILKQFVFQIFLFEFGEWIWSLLRKPGLIRVWNEFERFKLSHYKYLMPHPLVRPKTIIWLSKMWYCYGIKQFHIH